MDKEEKKDDENKLSLKSTEIEKDPCSYAKVVEEGEGRSIQCMLEEDGDDDDVEEIS